MINVIACGSITVTQVSAKGSSDIVTREIKRLSGRWRKRLNEEVNLLTWKGNKQRKNAKVVLIFGGGGGGGKKGEEEKERRGINPGYENTGKEEGVVGGGARKGDVHVSGEVILAAAAAELGSRSRRVPSAAPKFPRRRGGGEGGREGSAGGWGWHGAGGDQRKACHVMSRESGAHTGAAPRPSAPAVPRLPPAPSSPRRPPRRCPPGQAAGGGKRGSRDPR